MSGKECVRQKIRRKNWKGIKGRERSKKRREEEGKREEGISARNDVTDCR